MSKKTKKSDRKAELATMGEDPEAFIASLAQTIAKNVPGSIGTLRGKNAISDRSVPFTIPFGSLALDAITGIGGIPGGRIIEIYGPEASGKTTLALHLIASCQAGGGTAAFIDAEHALDPTYAEALGVQLDLMLFHQPESAEMALDAAEKLVRSGSMRLIVIDSVAALTPLAELEGEMGDTQVGLQARLMSKACRKLAGACQANNCTILFINQLRSKVGVMFGSPEVTSGGNALKYYASMRFDIRRIGAIKEGDAIVGNRTRVKMVKNKLAPPFQKVEFDIRYGEGVDIYGQLIDYGLDNGMISRSGAWYSFGTTKIGQGRQKTRIWLMDNPEACAKITEAVTKSWNA